MPFIFFLVLSPLNVGATCDSSLGCQEIGDQDEDVLHVIQKRIQFEHVTVGETEFQANRCEDWCVTHTKPWSNKCKWISCRGCTQCLPRCETWCGTNQQPWKKKCTWWKCRACMNCTTINPAPWTAAEVTAAKQKISDRFTQDLGKGHRQEPFTPGTVLRLSFHDCIRYKGGTGGCDGCLNWRGVGQENYPDLNHLPLNGPDPEEGDGANNNLEYVASALEELYESPLSQDEPSLKGRGKSRADFWALAGIAAVEYTMNVNNEVCASGRKPSESTTTKIGQCLWAHGEPGCKATPSRELVFKSGRRDCNTTSYITWKEENHPHAHMSGESINKYMKEEFGFNGRETVAIMGAHTIGVYHPRKTGFKYVWTPRSEMSFNNEYYRNIILDDHWIYNNDDCTQLGTAWGEKGHSKWHVKANLFAASGGPIQWIRMTHTCPDCHGAMPWESQWWSDDYKSCCTDNVPVGAICRPDNNREHGSNATEADDDLEEGCEKYKFLFGRDHAYLNTDMGLYFDFTVDDDGFPQQCPGFESFSGSKVNNTKSRPSSEFRNQGGVKGWRWAEPACPKQSYAEPPDSKPLYKYVEEFASDQTAWLDAYIPAMEKYLRSGYQATELDGVI